jgi:hypothetical protein
MTDLYDALTEFESPPVALSKLSALPGGEAKAGAARVNPMNRWCSHCYHGDGHCDGGQPGCTCPCRHAAALPGAIESAPNPPAAPSELTLHMAGHAHGLAELQQAAEVLYANTSEPHMGKAALRLADMARPKRPWLTDQSASADSGGEG